MYAQKAIVHNAPTLHTVRNVNNAHCAYRFKVQSCDCINCDCINFVRATEKITKLMNSYYSGLITNEEVIKELLKTAQEIAELYKNGQQLGLSQEELAFYDALTKPEHIKDFYEMISLWLLPKS